MTSDSIRHINNYHINFSQNLGVIFDDQLTFKEHIAKTARSCRFALHNIKKSGPFLTEHAAQLLVQALVVSRLDYCNALLAGLPSNTIKPLQMIQNAAARLVFNEPKRTHVTPSLHLTALATSGSSHQVQDTDACIQNDHRLSTLILPLTITNLHPSRSLRSASERRLVVPSQRGSKSLSRTFSFTMPGWWNNLPPLPECWIPVNLQATEDSSLRHYLTFILNLFLRKKKKKKKPFPLSFSPSLASLYLFEQ